MSDVNVWVTGLITMLVGMGIVFSFLVILVFAINVMVKSVAQINIWCPVAANEPKAKKAISSDNSEIALAIAVALAQK